jgi:hypothetical protein
MSSVLLTFINHLSAIEIVVIYTHLIAVTATESEEGNAGPAGALLSAVMSDAATATEPV